MEISIKSRKLNRTFEFSAPAEGGYIFMWVPDQYGNRHAVQVCEGGGFRGSTIRCTDEDNFQSQCRRWYRQYVNAGDTA